MNLINKIAIFSSLLGLWMVSFLSSQNQTLLGFILILTFGILHGANDLIIILQLKSITNTNIVSILIRYVFFIIISSLMFYVLPTFSLLCFVLVSGLHFGQQHFENYNLCAKNIFLNFFYLIYGLFVLFLLFLINQAEVIQVVHSITSYTLDPNFIIYTFRIIIILLFFSSFYLLNTEINFKKLIVQELFFIAIFLILFNSTSLIWGFALYFIFWHSLPSINSQIIFIYGNNQLNNFLKYAKSGFAYWFLAVTSLIIANHYLSDLKIFNAIFFSFLAAITFPHVIVMHKMFSQK